MPRFQSHGLMLYLSPELYLAFIKLQADKRLGRSFAGLLPFVEGLYAMGYISEDVYQEHKDRYSEPLVSKKSLNRREMKALEEKDELNKTLGKVMDQWDIHPSVEWRQKWADFARQHPELPNSPRVLQMAGRVSRNESTRGHLEEGEQK